MQFASCVALALLLSAAPVAAESEGASATPLQKVVQLLQGMAEKGKAEKHEEEVQYATYKQFCDDTSFQKTKAIAKAEGKIEVLGADISQYAADASQLSKEIAGHEEDVTAWTGDIKAATFVRGLEKEDYEALHEDYSESVDALKRAIAVLKKQDYDRDQASLVQLSKLKKLNLIPAQAKRAIDAFLSQDLAEDVGLNEPEAHGYDFQSSGIITMLDNLFNKFTQERTDLEKKEMAAQHAFDLLMQDLKAQIDSATEDKGRKAEMKAATLEKKADAKGDLDETIEVKDADKKYLADVTSTCEQKASEFDARQQLRADELVAIEKAVEVLGSDAVKGNAEKLLPSLAQKGRSLASLRADSQSENQARAVEFLKRSARQLDSRVLALLAGRVAADPFKKVKKMIKELLERLMEEAHEEAMHKSWCDSELKINGQTRTEKTEAVETLRAEIDELEAKGAKLAEEVGQLAQAVADSDAAVAKATKMREEEKETNAQTVKDSQEAQTAVAQALTVLKEFYEKAGQATALAQQAPGAPAIFDAPYKGMQAENGGVLGMLEVIQSDFARVESDTKASEAANQKEYDTFMTDSKVDKAFKEKDIEIKNAKKDDASESVNEKTKDLEGNQKELDAALHYYDKLKPSCVDAGVSYDDRVERRKAEIQSLKEALKILNGEDIA